MQGIDDGFVKLYGRRGTGIVLGGVVVAPRASELILGVSLAVEQSLTVDQMAHTFAVYPSLSGSLTEAAPAGSCSRPVAAADRQPQQLHLHRLPKTFGTRSAGRGEAGDGRLARQGAGDRGAAARRGADGQAAA